MTFGRYTYENARALMSGFFFGGGGYTRFGLVSVHDSVGDWNGGALLS